MVNPLLCILLFPVGCIPQHEVITPCSTDGTLF
jgi:hypothetical protein